MYMFIYYKTITILQMLIYLYIYHIEILMKDTLHIKDIKYIMYSINTYNSKQENYSAHFSSASITSGTIQRRLAWPLSRENTQTHEAFQIFWYTYDEH